jgi:hypothetical protein
MRFDLPALRPTGKNYHDVLAKGLWSAHHEGDRGPAAAAGTAVLHAEHMKMALTKLAFTFLNSERAQQFAGWLFLAGYRS